MKKESYQHPELEIVCFETEDVIRTSGIIPGDDEGGPILWP